MFNQHRLSGLNVMSTVLFVLHINGLATGQFGWHRVVASNGETNEECRIGSTIGLLGQTDGLAVGANKIELTADELAGVSDLRHADEGAAHYHDLSPSSRVSDRQVEHRAAFNVLEL